METQFNNTNQQNEHKKKGTSYLRYKYHHNTIIYDILNMINFYIYERY